MSLVTHLVVLGLLILDLILGASVVDTFWGRGPATGFEFVIILGYVLLILQWGVPWSGSKGGGG